MKTVLVAVLLTLLVPVSLPAEEESVGETRFVVLEECDLHAGPGLLFKKAGTARAGEVITAEEIQGEWVKCGDALWVERDRLWEKYDAPKTVFVRTNGARIRANPDLHSDVVGSAGKGDHLAVDGERNPWFHLAGGEGWIHLSLLERESEPPAVVTTPPVVSDQVNTRKWGLITLSGISFSLTEVPSSYIEEEEEVLLTLSRLYRLFTLSMRVPPDCGYKVEVSFNKGEIIVETGQGRRFENLRLGEIGLIEPGSMPDDTMSVEPGSAGSCLLFFDSDLKPAEIGEAYIYINDRLQKFYEIK